MTRIRTGSTCAFYYTNIYMIFLQNLNSLFSDGRGRAQLQVSGASTTGPMILYFVPSQSFFGHAEIIKINSPRLLAGWPLRDRFQQLRRHRHPVVDVRRRRRSVLGRPRRGRKTAENGRWTAVGSYGRSRLTRDGTRLTAIDLFHK